MNNEQQTWILRKPIEAWEYSSEELETQIPIYQYGKDDPELLTVMKDIWNEFFVPLDVSGLTRQVEELESIKYAVGIIAEYNSHIKDAEKHFMKEFVDDIVGLLLNQEKETK
jgi:hypothetical protein